MRILRQGPLSTTIELGDLTVTALSDGEAQVPGDLLRDAEGALLSPELRRAAGVEDGALRLPMRAFAVSGAAGCLLIDAGAGDAGPAGLGHLGAALIEAQISPRDVTAVALTHTHPGHVGGLALADGGPAFPQARRVHVATEELSAFQAMPRMRPVLSQVLPLEQGDGPTWGVTAVNAPGHSPGHMAYLVEGRLLIWGDLVHHPAQFANPRWTWGHDEDPHLARSSRVLLMEQAVEDGWLVAGAHLPEPGIGKLFRAGSGYAFRPIALD